MQGLPGQPEVGGGTIRGALSGGVPARRACLSDGVYEFHPGWVHALSISATSHRRLRSAAAVAGGGVCMPRQQLQCLRSKKQAQQRPLLFEQITLFLNQCRLLDQ